MNTDILEHLNDGQRQAVLYDDDPSLIIAGAGSGKAYVLTHKIAYHSHRRDSCLGGLSLLHHLYPSVCPYVCYKKCCQHE